MAGPTRAGRRGTDVDPFGSPTRDAPLSEWDAPRPPRRPGGNGHTNGDAHGDGRGNGQGGPPGRRNGGGVPPQPTSGGPGGRPPRAGGPSGERPAPKKRSIIWRWRRAFFLLALMGLLAVAAGGAVLAQTELPPPKTFHQATFICPAYLQGGAACTEETAMAKLQGDDANRVNVAYDDLSEHIINAVVATEDRNFFTHDGVAPLGIARALYRDLKGDAIQQGGSTITQQYVKNAYLTSERSLTRKLKEAVLSIKLEQRMSKQEILENYLNTVYFGRGAYGIQAASRAYFATNASELDIGQAAYLAGLMRAPEAADASLHPEEAARRRRTSLNAMEQEGYISADEADLYNEVTFEAPYFLPRQSSSRVTTLVGNDYGVEYVTSYVAQLLMDPEGPFKFTEEEVYGGGLRVYTSLDLDMQGRAWAAVSNVLNQPGDPQAGMVALDDQGMVRALVGARAPAPGETKPEINFAVRGSGSDGRAAGSTFKAIAVAEAVASGKSLSSRYDAPATLTIDQTGLPGCAETYELSNYAESEGGNLDLVEATAQSSNTAFAQLMVDLTPQKVIDMAKKLGMPGEFEVQCPSMVLGTENASPLDMAGVYSVFANRGVKKTPELITRVDKIGDEGEVTTLYNRQPPAGERVLTPQQADLVTHALQRVITDGTGTAADIGRPAAGKTGTSQDYKDAWFVGYVPKLTAAVWMGYPDADWIDPETNKPSLLPMSPRGKPVHGKSATGGSFPAQIWHDFMVSTLDARNLNDPFPEVPEELIQAGIRLDEGRIPEETTTTPPPQQPGTPPPSDGRPGNGPRPTRPGGGNTTTTEEPTTTTSSSTSTTTDTTAPPTSDTIIPLPTTRPGGGGGPGAGTG